MLYKVSQCCIKYLNVVQSISMLYKPSQCCIKYLNVVQSISMLYKVSQCCIKYLNVVQSISMLYKVSSCKTFWLWSVIFKKKKKIIYTKIVVVLLSMFKSSTPLISVILLSWTLTPLSTISCQLNWLNNSPNTQRKQPSDRRNIPFYE